MNLWRIREPRSGDRLRNARDTVWSGAGVSVGLGLTWVTASALVAVLVPGLGGVGMAAVAGGLLVGVVTRVPGEWATLPGFLAMCGAFVLVFRESVPSGRGWLVGNGRLAAVEVRAWSGEVAGTPQPVTALEVRPSRRRARLEAVLDDGRRVTVVAGRADRVAAVAGWLSDRADVPLTQAGGGVIGMTVASGQVNR